MCSFDKNEIQNQIPKIRTMYLHIAPAFSRTFRDSGKDLKSKCFKIAQNNQNQIFF